MAERQSGNSSLTWSMSSCRTLSFLPLSVSSSRFSLADSPFSSSSPSDSTSRNPRSEYMSAGNRVALVCSARSGTTKATGTTNLLLRAAAEALRPKPQDLSSSVPSLLNSPSASPSGTATPRTPGVGTPSLSNSLASLRLFDRGGEGERQLFDETVDQIKRDHLEAARKVVTRDTEVLREVEEELEYDCERLRGFLKAAQVRSLLLLLLLMLLPPLFLFFLVLMSGSGWELTICIAQIIDEISTRSKDSIMGVGERLSCRIVTAALRDRVRSRFLPSLLFSTLPIRLLARECVGILRPCRMEG